MQDRVFRDSGDLPPESRRDLDVESWVGAGSNGRPNRSSQLIAAWARASSGHALLGDMRPARAARAARAGSPRSSKSSRAARIRIMSRPGGGRGEGGGEVPAGVGSSGSGREAATVLRHRSTSPCPGPASARFEAFTGRLGLAGDEQQSREGAVVEGECRCSSDVAAGSTNLVMVATRGSSGSGRGRRRRMPLGRRRRPAGVPNQPPDSRSHAARQVAQFGGQYRGTVELAGLDAHPRFHRARVSVMYGPRGKPSFGPACRVRSSASARVRSPRTRRDQARWGCANTIES